MPLHSKKKQEKKQKMQSYRLATTALHVKLRTLSLLTMRLPYRDKELRFFSPCPTLNGNMNAPSQQYKELVAQGKLNPDPKQLLVLEKLDRLHEKLQNYNPNLTFLKEEEKKSLNPSWLSFIYGNSKDEMENDTPRSLYIHGGVGCGKTMLMDLFYNCAPTKQKLRTHFNSFMLHFHSRLHQLRAEIPHVDHVPTVIKEILQKHWLLCFDEFQVTDIADAMILKRLFEALLKNGAVMVATSNRAPDELYENGLNRPIFIPFIHFLKEKCDIHNMSSESDYRLTGQQSTTTVYYVYHNETEREQANQKVNQLFKQLTSPIEPERKIVTAMGATMIIPESARGVAKFSFNDICRKAYGAALFIELCKNYHTVVLIDVPKMDIFHSGDALRRFIILIDELYQHNVKLICSAAAEPENLLLFPDGKGKQDFLDQDNVFAFDRTISRLKEMQNREYLMKGHIQIHHTSIQ
jgi:predicted ATPase